MDISKFKPSKASLVEFRAYLTASALKWVGSGALLMTTAVESVANPVIRIAAVSMVAAGVAMRTTLLNLRYKDHRDAVDAYSKEHPSKQALHIRDRFASRYAVDLDTERRPARALPTRGGVRADPPRETPTASSPSGLGMQIARAALADAALTQGPDSTPTIVIPTAEAARENATAATQPMRPTRGGRDTGASR